jgi:hypothetical protein
MPVEQITFCDCITEHIYFKAFAVFVLSMLITFVDDIEILYSKYIFVILLFIFSLILFTTGVEFVGVLILLMMLIVFVHNNEKNRERSIASSSTAKKL